MADFLAVVFLAEDFLAVVFLAEDFFATERFVPRAAFASSFFFLPGQSMFTQMRHGPRCVTTSTMGAPHSGHTSPVACSSPRWGSG